MPTGTDPEARLPMDATVKIPPGVAAASAAADAAHALAYPQAAPATSATSATLAAPAAPAPAPVAPAKPIPDANEPGSWEHRYLAMKGRYDQSQATIGGLQEQMGELGDELMRTQSQMRRAPAADPLNTSGQRPVGQAPRKLVTDKDVDTYGTELIDFIQRAAREGIAPDLTRVQQGVRQVAQKVGQVTQADMMSTLDAEVPTWKQINLDPRFKQWCRLPDVYSGAVRGTMLNTAFQAADAPRVVAFFKGFLAEEQATGQIPAPQTTQQAQTELPRTAAVSLESLAAPGRPKPAGGDTPASAADKPVYTRAQINAFYTAVRRGEYTGREQEKMNLETSLFAAQREGRIRG